MAELHPLDRLQLERRRTQFVFYGFRLTSGERGGAYFKLAHSLGEALTDLAANASVADEGLFVSDAFLEQDEGEPTIHVELCGEWWPDSPEGA